ncbi:phosphate signaling complex protein PhoU [Chrysiogenes arsenatis]|uniref:phosphate signaling complex protein PhoU n=1 Tax=Chrysiogenes arsenatis TaxID=309797 RepID=UPI00040C3A24|nr:phosphate signaling complex protein PhoU [Chrysiogenes arsenatis]
MSIIFLREIDGLKSLVEEMCTLVTENFDNTVRAINTLDVALAHSVMLRDEEIDRLEVRITEECFKVIALHQPVATDLRFIIALIQFNTYLENIGDLSEDLASMVISLSKHLRVTSPFDIDEMSAKVKKVLDACVDCLIHLDGKRAKEAIALDDEVDVMHKNNYRMVKDQIILNPDHIEQNMYYLSASRYLERVADYATNIAEEVVYIVQGDIIRHAKLYKKQDGKGTF